MICEAELRTLMERFPGEYCVSVRQNGKLVQRVIRIWKLWGSQEPFMQGYGAPSEPFVATSEDWIMLRDLEAIAPYYPAPEMLEPSTGPKDAPKAVSQEETSLPSDYWLS